MGFAEGYLQKHAIGQTLIQSVPDPDLYSIIAIPAYNESGLSTCLDSLFSCKKPDQPVEVIVLINSGEDTPREIIELNRITHREVTAWSAAHKRKGFTVHPVLLEKLPRKHIGAGLARKLVMDEAVRRFNQLDRPAGLILSLDADTLVEQNYLQEVTRLFERSPEADGCSIRFAHPVSEDELRVDLAEQVNTKDVEPGIESLKKKENQGTWESESENGSGSESETESENGSESESENGSEGGRYPASVYNAIINYELHQRYYLEAVRSTCYPYAFHTVGSAFAVRAGAYCRQGGMSKRQAGEDFYFIQKVAMQGHYTECNTTTVYPSPRPSDRVPFGTGPDIARQLETPGQPYLTHAPELFRHLRALYALIPQFYAMTSHNENTKHTGRQGPGDISDPVRKEHSTHADIQSVSTSLPTLLQNYLASTGFLTDVSEIHANVASEAAFQQRFFRKFNMFWILKYLHFAGERGIEKAEVGVAAREMLEMRGINPGDALNVLRDLNTGKPVSSSPGKSQVTGSAGTPGAHLTHLDLLRIYRKIQAATG